MFLVLLLVFGCTGNVIKLLSTNFARMTSLEILTIAMNGACFITCLLVIVEIDEIRGIFTKQNVKGSACSVWNAIFDYFSFTTGLLLISCAIEQRQRIARPLEWQMSRRFSIILIVVIFIVCIILTVPAHFVEYDDDVNVKTTKVIIAGTCCRYVKPRSLYVQIYATIVILICIISFIICAVAYTQIILYLNPQIIIVNDDTRKLSEAMLAGDDPSSLEDSNRKASVTYEMWIQFLSTFQKKRKTQKTLKERRNSCIILFVATGLTYMGFLMQFTSIIIVTNVKTEYIPGHWLSVDFFLRSGRYIYSATVPIACSLFNRILRKRFGYIYRNIVTLFYRFKGQTV